MSLPRALRMIYREIPALRCKPRCGRCCGPVPWSLVELARVTIPPDAEGLPEKLGGAIVLLNPKTGCCPFLDAETRACSVYERRPYMCRLFGATLGEGDLLCPEGCRPKQPLSRSQAAKLTMRYIEIERMA